MLVDEARCIVDLIVYHNEEILLGVVLRDVGVGIFLVGHCGGVYAKLVLRGSEETIKSVAGSRSVVRGEAAMLTVR